MKKIPTLFKRIFDGHKIVGITDEITPGCERAFREGTPTIKFDGACCAIIDGAFYKRYDCKKGKTPPEGAITCCDPDPITGHWPHWVKVDPDDPADKWFRVAYGNVDGWKLDDATYEAVGPHFQGNPYGFDEDFLIRHGCEDVYLLDENGNHTFENIKLYLETHEIEGLVFWLDGKPVCKIKRTDFGLPWPVKKEEK